MNGWLIAAAVWSVLSIPVRRAARLPAHDGGVKLRERTVRAALDADESQGFAIARFAIEEGDLAYNPNDPRAMILGPARLTYTRHDGRTTVRIT